MARRNVQGFPWLAGALALVVGGCGATSRGRDVSRTHAAARRDDESTASIPPAALAPARAHLPAHYDFSARLGDAGCFEIAHLGTTERLVSSSERCARPRRPYSTFKLANALIGLDVGVLSGPDDVMPIDEDLRSPQDLPAWRGHHTLRSGLAASSVPHFRTLARRIGLARMNDGLARLGYGNRDTGGGLDLFWLRGALRISADEQLRFVSALARGELAVSPHAQDVVREIARIDARDGAVLYGKTGTGSLEDAAHDDDDARTLGWLVGWVTRGTQVFPFAMWIEGNGFDATRTRRTEVARRILDELGLIPAS